MQIRNQLLTERISHSIADLTSLFDVRPITLTQKQTGSELAAEVGRKTTCLGLKGVLHVS